MTVLCVVMDPGSPSLLWPLRLSKPAVVSGEHSKAERAASPALERLASSPPSPAPPAPASPQPQQFQAALVADKYLLLEQVEGSSLCRCVDVRTEEEYVCKVSQSPHSFTIASQYTSTCLGSVPSSHINYQQSISYRSVILMSDSYNSCQI